MPPPLSNLRQPSRDWLIPEHWKSRVLLQSSLHRTTEEAFLFELQTQRTPHARRRGDLRRQFVRCEDNAPQIRHEILAAAAFAKALACHVQYRRMTIVIQCDWRLLM